MDYTGSGPSLVPAIDSLPTSHASVTWHKNVQDIVVGSIAGMAGKIFEYPFDTVKVRLQTQSLTHPTYTGPWNCFQKTLRTEGPLGFYKGLSSPLVGAMLENAILFLGYNEAQKYIRSFSGNEILTISQLSLAGGISGVFASLFLTPIELVKCKLQVQTSDVTLSTPRAHSFKGPIHVITHTFRTHGPLGFYRGHLATFFRETGGGAAWFGIYEYACAAMLARSSSPSPRTKKDLTTPQLMFAGAIAGMAYNFTFFPTDVIKSRMQIDEELIGAKRGFLGVARDIWRGNGVRGFYRGCGITVLRSAPSSAIIFMTYETLTQYFESIR